MSIVEKALYWVSIVVLVIALIGIKGNISQIEAKISQITVQTPSEE